MEGTHKGCPYRLSSLGVRPWGGHPQGVPLPIVFSRRLALGRAPTRGAPTGCLLSAFGPGEGTHKGCPYRLSSLGVRPWGGHPQGAPLPIVFSRRSALGRAPTRGAPTAPTRGAPCLLSAFGPGEGTHKGCPYRLSSLGVFGPGEGTHKGRPYRLSSLGVRPWGGHPQGVPLVFSRRFALGRAPTRGAPTDCLLSAFGPGEGTHKGRPYRLSSLGVRRLALGRAPTRGAPTDCLLSASSLGVRPWGGHPQGVPLLSSLGVWPDYRGPGEGTHSTRSSLGVLPWGGHPQGVPLFDAIALGRAPTRGPYPIQAASRGFF